MPGCSKECDTVGPPLLEVHAHAWISKRRRVRTRSRIISASNTRCDENRMGRWDGDTYMQNPLETEESSWIFKVSDKIKEPCVLASASFIGPVLFLFPMFSEVSSEL